MDEELTAGYNEPCVQCSAVHWGISDGGQFFCKNCHNVIERIRDDVDEFFVTRSARASRIASRRQKKGKTGREWLVCEGFQFILKHQAEALVSLGVDPLFKSKVLINLWRRYLQKTRQAYTHQPIRTAKFCTDMTSESEGESVGTRSERSGPVSDNSESMRSEWSEPLSDASEGFDSASGLSSVGASSVWSGSLDADMYISSKERKAHHLMSMPRTLALCHLALLWMREAITLSALLRLVYDDRVPYINAYKVFPEEMKPYGRDFGIFRVESLPSYRKVHKEAVEMAEILELPSFPPISEECLLHPTLLTVHYLQELNLPDELHVWVCKIIEKSRIKEESFLTFDPTIRNPTLPFYDLQAAAAIIVALKLLYGLNDRTEWIVSTIAERKRRDKKKKKGVEDKKIFSLRKWYKIVQPAVTQAKEREERALARKQWKSIKVIVPSLKAKSVVLKRRRVVDHLQRNLQKFFASDPNPQPTSSSSSFRFCWGDEADSHGPSFHGRKLGGALGEYNGIGYLRNSKYWHAALRPCAPTLCKSHYPEVEPTLPRTYVWLLGVFSFLLGVKESQIHEEVAKVERRFLSS